MKYFKKAEELIGERIEDVRAAFDESWTGSLIGGGTAIANMMYNPTTRHLRIISHRPPVDGEIEINIGKV